MLGTIGESDATFVRDDRTLIGVAQKARLMRRCDQRRVRLRSRLQLAEQPCADD